MIRSSGYRGFSLLEVLIAIFILGLGLLLTSDIYMRAYRRFENSYWHTLANSHLISVAEISRTSGDDFCGSLINCNRILPHGDCIFAGREIKVCWREGEQEICLPLLKTYGH